MMLPLGVQIMHRIVHTQACHCIVKKPASCVKKKQVSILLCFFLVQAKIKIN